MQNSKRKRNKLDDKKNRNPVAVLSLGIGAGILIYEADNEKVTFAWELNGKTEKIRQAGIKYNSKGEPFFMTQKKRHYLKDFLKTNL